MGAKIFSSFFLYLIAINSVYCQTANSIWIDSASVEFNKYNKSDSFFTKLKHLQTAIKYYPVDSFYMHLAHEFRSVGALKESEKYSLKALKAPIQTNLYLYLEIEEYIASSRGRGKLNEVQRILEKSVGDTIFFKRKKLPRWHIAREIQDLFSYKQMLKETILSLMRKNSLSNSEFATLAFTYYKLGLYKKANHTLRRGLRQYNGNSLLYFCMGQIQLFEGKYQNSLKAFNISSLAGNEDATRYLPLLEQLVDF